jgi:hypothetical protein
MSKKRRIWLTTADRTRTCLLEDLPQGALESAVEDLEAIE